MVAMPCTNGPAWCTNVHEEEIAVNADDAGRGAASPATQDVTDEVRQIIEKDTGFNKYIKEVDLLGLDLDSEPQKHPEKQPESSRGSPRSKHRPAQHRHRQRRPVRHE